MRQQIVKFIQEQHITHANFTEGIKQLLQDKGAVVVSAAISNTGLTCGYWPVYLR